MGTCPSCSGAGIFPLAAGSAALLSGFWKGALFLSRPGEKGAFVAHPQLLLSPRCSSAPTAPQLPAFFPSWAFGSLEPSVDSAVLSTQMRPVSMDSVLDSSEWL